MSDLWSDEEQESELMEEQEEEVEGRRQGDNEMEDILETDEDDDASATVGRESRGGGREEAEGRSRGEEEDQQQRGGRPDGEQSPSPSSPPPQPPVLFPPPSITPTPEEDAGAAVPSWSAVLNTLGPDHPLLKRFQEAKRRQLLQEKDQLQLRLRQLQQQTEDFRQENVTLGAQLFDVQQSVTRAQVNLDKIKSERKRIRQARQTAQETLQHAKEEEKSVVDALNQAKKHEITLHQEVSRMGSRVAVLQAARAQSDGDVTTLTRALHNTAWDRANLEKDKMSQDLFVERLTAALEREKVTLKTLREAIQEEKEVTKALDARARLQQEELEQLESEAVGVKRAWETNVLVLQKRSEDHSASYQHLEKLLAQQAGLKAEVYNTRKVVREEQIRHEKDSARLIAQERDVTKRRERLAVLREEAQQMAERHEGLLGIVDQLDQQYQLLKKEASEEARRLERVYGRVKSATERYRKMEDLALEKIGEHTAASKAALNLRKRVKEARTKCRMLEDDLVEREKYAADAALRASDGRAAVLALTSSRDEAQRVVDQLDDDVARFESDMRRGQEKISANQCAIDRLNKELAKVIEIAGGSEAPPAEREERRLRLLLQDRETERKVLEEEALTVQRQLLEAREAREALVQKTTRLQQELTVLRGRQTRLEGTVEREKGALREAQIRQERLHKAIATLDARLHQEKSAREAASRESEHTESDLLAKLQELELEASRKESEEDQLRKKKELTEGKLLEATQERAEWEKKVVEMRDARDALRKEVGAEGDLHAMKTEINRMQARWRMLEATQKDLSGRLEQSVAVEGSLKSRTVATVEKLRRDPNAAKATRLMQEDILKRKISKCKRRLGDLQDATEMARQERLRAEDECQRKERVYAQNVRLLQEAASHLEEKLVKKQEEQLRLQEHRARLRHLTALRDGRYKTLTAPSEEAQQALKNRLIARAHAYTGVVTQLEASYPQMEVKLRNLKVFLHNFLEPS
ncbi:coiled-coil domain-containing protein 40-like [Penaeus chinensis]|uniref:coiled-coil domain-containing protein 40-like n=1 Tax=Penaeus chinensis TaxID=139456 RepID=UPI001FB6A33F|nr:coiled-coil domain-containing protein 40-like [Penaeus chinensis]